MNSNGKSFRVFTVASGQVTEGTSIRTLKLKGAGIEIPAIMIGEKGADLVKEDARGIRQAA